MVTKPSGPKFKIDSLGCKLSEYDFSVEHSPGTRMRHADALSRNVNLVETELTLLKDITKEEQEKDELCGKYRQYENFWTDEGVLYRQESKESPCTAISTTLVHRVLTCYHELPFTAHQGVSRTVKAVSSKYWWEILRDDVSKFIKGCEACAKRKTGHRVTAPLGVQNEVTNFCLNLWTTLLDFVKQFLLPNKTLKLLHENLLGKL